jgi:ribose 5-phosphate isomerase A
MEELKREAARFATRWIRDGMVLGLGTGSTVSHLLTEIARQRAEGEWREVVGVPTSEATAARARELGIPLVSLGDRPRVDLTIDGADEVDPQLRLIKGLGGALLREKVVAAASREVVIIVDRSKRVERLGTLAPLPVEVDPFAAPALPGFLRSLGAEPRLRVDSAGAPVLTDGGHQIFDCRFASGINDPEGLEMSLNNRPGVLENGLFLNMADRVVFAGEGGIQVVSRGAEGEG